MNRFEVRHFLEDHVRCFYTNDNNDRLCFVFDGKLEPSQMQGFAHFVVQLLCPEKDGCSCGKTNAHINEEMQKRNHSEETDKTVTTITFSVHENKNKPTRPDTLVKGATALKIKMMGMFLCLEGKDCKEPTGMQPKNILAQPPGHELG